LEKEIEKTEMLLGLASKSRMEVREDSELYAVDLFLCSFLVLERVVETTLMRSSSDDWKNVLKYLII